MIEIDITVCVPHQYNVISIMSARTISWPLHN